MLTDTIYEIVAARFHEAGERKFIQWHRYCREIVDRGADPEIAKLIIGTPNGINVVPVLFRNQTLLDELKAKKTRRARVRMLHRIAKSETVQ